MEWRTPCNHRLFWQAYRPADTPRSPTFILFEADHRSAIQNLVGEFRGEGFRQLIFSAADLVPLFGSSAQGCVAQELQGGRGVQVMSGREHFLNGLGGALLTEELRQRRLEGAEA